MWPARIVTGSAQADGINARYTAGMGIYAFYNSVLELLPQDYLYFPCNHSKIIPGDVCFCYYDGVLEFSNTASCDG